MPTVDYPCKVINLESGYSRTNRSWTVGRLLRDLEAKELLSSEAMSISIYKAVKRRRGDILDPGKTMLGLATILLQLGIAIIPFGLYRDWGIAMITTLGTFICLSTAALPQWRVEKLACRLKSKKKIAMTAGNGSRHVIVILGEGYGLDIEDLAAAEGPRHARPWERAACFVHFYETSSDTKEATISRKTVLTDARNGVYNQSISIEEAMDAYVKDTGLTAKVDRWDGLPLPFWITCILWAVFTILWAVLLISVVALRANAWYLAAIGTIGMIQNALVAAASREPRTRGMVLKRKLILYGDKVMDVLMDLESVLPGCGRTLVKEFFPGSLDVPKDRGEKDWWDQKKIKDAAKKPTDSAAVDQGEGSARQREKDMDRYDKCRYEIGNSGKRYDERRNTERTRGWKGGIKREKLPDF